MMKTGVCINREQNAFDVSRAAVIVMSSLFRKLLFHLIISTSLVTDHLVLHSSTHSHFSVGLLSYLIAKYTGTGSVVTARRVTCIFLFVNSCVSSTSDASSSNSICLLQFLVPATQGRQSKRMRTTSDGIESQLSMRKG